MEIGQSKYAKRFNLLRESGFAPKLRGATILVEVLPKEELKTKGGIILGQVDKTHKATAEDARRNLALVLLVGEGYADGSICETKVGQLILMPFAPVYLSDWPGLGEYTQNTLALVNDADVLVVYDGFEHLANAREALG